VEGGGGAEQMGRMRRVACGERAAGVRDSVKMACAYLGWGWGFGV